MQLLKKILDFLIACFAGLAVAFGIYKIGESKGKIEGENAANNDILQKENELLKKNLQIQKEAISYIGDADSYIDRVLSSKK